MTADLFLTNGQIVTHDGVFHGCVSVKDGKIHRVIEGDENVPAEQVINLNGKLVLPGLVDGHVHFNEPGREAWEGASAGSASAAAGGITTSLEMPFNALPVTNSAALLQAKRKAVEDKLITDMGHWGLLDDSNLDELKAMHDLGTVGFKTFMCDPQAFGWSDSFVLLEAMKHVAEYGNLIAVHAEDESLTCGLTEKLKRAGRNDLKAWSESRPPISELEAIKRAILIASETRANLHIVHISIPQGVDEVWHAKQKGLNVTAETCPHYLALDEDDLIRIGPLAKCGPPLRAREHVEELWEHVLNGKIDVIGSDHCPCTPEMKANRNDVIWEVWGGISGNQTMLPILLTEGVHKRGLSLVSLVRMTSYNPSQIFGLFPHKGNLAPGADADIVIIDPNKEWILEKEMLFSKHKLSPFIGNSFVGMVEKTFLRGRLVYSDSEITCEPGYGEILKRNLSVLTQ